MSAHSSPTLSFEEEEDHQPVLPLLMREAHLENSDSDEDAGDRSEEKIAQAVATCRALYDSGKPFFTKDAIRRLVQAFDNREEVAAVTGVNGVDIRFRIETGKPWNRFSKRDSDFEIIKLACPQSPLPLNQNTHHHEVASHASPTPKPDASSA